MGGAGFSSQITKTPAIVRRAFDLGLKATDTSPYYDLSEQLIGEALSHPGITAKYKRKDYFLMTKVGRITSTQFDYSPKWVRTSVTRSLERLHTTYLDVVFCHDVEFVTKEEAMTAVGTLLSLQEAGHVKHVAYRAMTLTRWWQ
jgi:D-arabinose 1-dehydrogenase